MASKKYTTAKLAGEFIALLGRTFKSFLFNCLIFILGFGLGVTICINKVHSCATANCNYECIDRLDQQLEQQRQLDKQIDQSIKEIRTKIAHDHHRWCETDLGQKIIKQ